MKVVRPGTRVWVTGSAGVIGRELLTLLSARGADVLSIDRVALDAPRPGVRHLTLDLGAGDLDEVRAFAPEVVLHLAAAFERSRETPEFWGHGWNDNVLASHRVIEATAALPSVSTFVFASSYLLYDPSLYLFATPRSAPVLLQEEMPLAPRNLCGAAKWYAERELDFVREHLSPNLRTVLPRIYRVYGRGSRDVVSRWVRAALRGEPIEVWNGASRFDYVYAGDVAAGILCLADTEAAQGSVNLATGRAHSVDEMLATIASRLPVPADTVKRVRVDEPFEASAADVGRLRALTGWSPQTTLEQGIDELIAYERAQGAPR